MSQTQATEQPAQKAEEILEAGIIKKIEQPENKIVESALPEAPDKTKQIQDLLDIKKSMGLNLTDKETKVRIYKEIAEQVSCSYQLVDKVAKKHLNASKAVIKESVVADKNKINIKGVDDDARPPPRIPPKTPEVMKKPMSNEQLQQFEEAKIKFEADMILMSFENISGFENMFFGFSPKSAKMKRIAMTVATYNQMMRNNGKPEEVINVGDKIMKYMLWTGIAGMFLTPLVEMIQRKDKKQDGITPKKEKSRMV